MRSELSPSVEMKNTITTILVDDEPLARKLLKEYLQDFPEIRVVAECKNGRQAVKAINEDKPDVVFLDIRMPGMDGFEVLENLNHMPHIVFSTAYGDYALKAFEMNAVDYLLKPYDRKRFTQAMYKVLNRSFRRKMRLIGLSGYCSNQKIRDLTPPAFYPKREKDYFG